MTSNYNQIFTGKTIVPEYKAGDRFDIGNSWYRFDPRISCFQGLEIKAVGNSITGKVLEFDYQEWSDARNRPRPDFDKKINNINRIV